MSNRFYEELLLLDGKIVSFSGVAYPTRSARGGGDA